MAKLAEIIQAESLVRGPLELCCYSRQVHLNQEVVNVTGLEFNLLYLLVDKSPNIVSQRQIANYIFDGVLAGNEPSIFTHISNLRRKLKCKSDQIAIQSIRGRGYCLLS